MLDRREMQYLYKEGKEFVMMDNESYEQLHLSEAQVGGGIKYLKENMVLQVLLHDGKVIGVDIPTHVELEVVDTPPSEKGNTSSGGTKPATLETGAVVNVPFFVSNGDKIRVDTRNNEYLDRV
jgi:elongation factor P